MQITDNAEVMGTLTRIIREVFDDESLVACDNMTAADVQKWDSLSHIDLVHAVEHRFSIRLTTREITSLKNIGDLAKLIQKKLAVLLENHTY